MKKRQAQGDHRTPAQCALDVHRAVQRSHDGIPQHQAAAAADGEHALPRNIADCLFKQAEFALEHVFVFHKPGVVLRRVAVKFGFHRQVILSVLSIFKVPPAVSASLLSCAAGRGKTGRACAFLMNHSTISSLPQRYVRGKYPSPFARVHGSYRVRVTQ